MSVHKILQAGYVHSVPRVAAEHKQPVALARQRHRMAERVGRVADERVDVVFDVLVDIEIRAIL
jgi:hypothetical protein